MLNIRPASKSELPSPLIVVVAGVGSRVDLFSSFCFDFEEDFEVEDDFDFFSVFAAADEDFFFSVLPEEDIKSAAVFET